MDYGIINTEAVEQLNENVETVQTPDEVPRQSLNFWEYFGLTALFAVPIVGFIVCAILMFTPKRQAMKNYARAVMAFMGIRLVNTIVIFIIIFNIIGNNLILPIINNSLNTDFQNINEVIDVTGDLMSKNYSGVIDTLRPQLTKSLGEEYNPLLKELSKKKYNELFSQILNEDYDTILYDFQSGKYEDLAKVIGNQEFAEFVNEVEKASNGEPTDLFDGINSFFSILPSNDIISSTY